MYNFFDKLLNANKHPEAEIDLLFSAKIPTVKLSGIFCPAPDELQEQSAIWRLSLNDIKHMLTHYPDLQDTVFDMICHSDKVIDFLLYEPSEFITLFQKRYKDILFLFFRPDIWAKLMEHSFNVKELYALFPGSKEEIDELLFYAQTQQDWLERCQAAHLSNFTVSNISETEAGPRSQNPMTLLAFDIANKSLIENCIHFQLNASKELIGTFPDGQEINLSILLKHADFTQLELSEEFLEALELLIKRCDRKFDSKNVIEYFIDLYTNPNLSSRDSMLFPPQMYSHINNLLRGLPINADLPSLGLKILFLSPFILCHAINKGIKFIDEPEQQAITLFRRQGHRRPMGLHASSGIMSFSEKEHRLFGIYRLTLPSSYATLNLSNGEQERILSHGTLFRTDRVHYQQGFPCEFNLSVSNSPEPTPPHYAYLTDLALRYAHDHFLSRPYSRGGSRKYHDTCHAIRNLHFLDYALVYFKEHAKERFKTFFKAITQDDLLWVKIALIFWVTGRDSEISPSANPAQYAEFKKASSQNFQKFLNDYNVPFDSKVFPEALLDADAQLFIEVFMQNSERPTVHLKNLATHPSPYGDRFLVMALLVHMAHSLDLTRCYGPREFHKSVTEKFDVFIEHSPQQEKCLDLLKRHASIAVNKTWGLDCTEIGETQMILAKLGSVFLPDPSQIEITPESPRFRS